jgi:outer membrane biosynthesis protein TonB
MRKAAIISLLLHLSVVVIALIGFPSLFRSETSPDQVVPVEMVMVEARAKPPAPEPPKAKPKPKHKPKPPPKTVRAAPPPPPPALLPDPEPVPQAKPEPKPRPKHIPKPKPRAKPKPKPKPVAKPPVRTARQAPKPRRKPKPPPDRFQTLLKNLAKQSKEIRKEDLKAKSPPKPVQVARAAPPPRRQTATIDRRRLAAGLALLVKQQISQCWNIPGGAKDVQNMQIAIRIRLNPDGTLLGVPRIADVGRMRGDPFYRAVAESALRALRNPGCSPLKLPYDQYDLWKSITLNFDPGEALGP